MPYPPPSGSHRRHGKALNYLGRKDRERATNPGGRARRLLTTRPVGRVGWGPLARSDFNQGLAQGMEEDGSRGVRPRGGAVRRRREARSRGKRGQMRKRPVVGVCAEGKVSERKGRSEGLWKGGEPRRVYTEEEGRQTRKDRWWEGRPLSRGHRTRETKTIWEKAAAVRTQGERR